MAINDGADKPEQRTESTERSSAGANEARAEALDGTKDLVKQQREEMFYQKDTANRPPTEVSLMFGRPQIDQKDGKPAVEGYGLKGDEASKEAGKSGNSEQSLSDPRGDKSKPGDSSKDKGSEENDKAAKSEQAMAKELGQALGQKPVKPEDIAKFKIALLEHTDPKERQDFAKLVAKESGENGIYVMPMPDGSFKTFQKDKNKTEISMPQSGKDIAQNLLIGIKDKDFNPQTLLKIMDSRSPEQQGQIKAEFKKDGPGWIEFPESGGLKWHNKDVVLPETKAKQDAEQNAQEISKSKSEVKAISDRAILVYPESNMSEFAKNGRQASTDSLFSVPDARSEANAAKPQAEAKSAGHGDDVKSKAQGVISAAERLNKAIGEAEKSPENLRKSLEQAQKDRDEAKRDLVEAQKASEKAATADDAKMALEQAKKGGKGLQKSDYDAWQASQKAVAVNEELKSARQGLSDSQKQLDLSLQKEAEENAKRQLEQAQKAKEEEYRNSPEGRQKAQEEREARDKVAAERKSKLLQDQNDHKELLEAKNQSRTMIEKGGDTQHKIVMNVAHDLGRKSDDAVRQALQPMTSSSLKDAKEKYKDAGYKELSQHAGKEEDPAKKAALVFLMLKKGSSVD